ncbi:SapC family protein [Parapedomonas caeni]
MTTTTPAETRLPLFYNSVVPLAASVHGKLVMTEARDCKYAANTHAIPITVDEFVMVQRHYPIIFGGGDSPVPLALVGLMDNENQFIDAEGQWRPGTYVPAYVRRYPFLLAKLTPEAKELSLCFDDSAPIFTTGEESNLFDGNEPTERTKAILQFCEQFEIAIQRTRAFMNELKELDLLMDGEAQIQPANGAAPANFRGFRMISEQKLHELRGDQVRKMVKSGALGLIYAHLFSLSHIQGLYQYRMEQQAQDAA